jgi:hypothetical protein
MSYIGCMGYMGSGNVRGLRKLFWIVVQMNTVKDWLPIAGIRPPVSDPNKAEQDQNSALRICVYPCPSVVVW